MSSSRQTAAGSAGVVRRIGCLAVAGLLVSACSGGSVADRSRPPGRVDRSTTTTGLTRAASGALELRPLSVSPDKRIVDDLDREVLLRGANVNSLGEYWQGDPETAPTIPLSTADWNAMAAHGFSAVRLIVSWSRIEPTRGSVDHSYLDKVEAYVDAAAARGIYTVIDMHQDAYSAFIHTDDRAECPAGTEPAKGWDGAPKWATITDGLSTCVTGDRNSSPAVVAAWNHFYRNTDGIRDRFAAAWAAVAHRFAGRPEVAGYDLLNEPEVSMTAAELTPLYEQLLADTIDAIRRAETKAPFAHLLIVEPAIPAGDLGRGLVIPDPKRMGVDPANVVAGPHNYAESISNGLDLSIEAMSSLFSSVAAGLGLGVWIGEYGWWDREPATLEKIRRYAADEDSRAMGGTWWQWRQSCGDPHSFDWGHTAQGDEVHLNIVGCPGNKDLGPNEAFLSVLGRAFPRNAPGRVSKLTSDPRTGELTLTAAGASRGAQLVVWSPTRRSSVTGSGLDDIESHEVPGGRIVTASVASPAYELRIDGDG